ncbi:UNVERIFIED_CONTAM: hypothetical protein NCL1_14491 [Trichonephila clavipes]
MFPHLRQLKEARFVLGTFRSERMRVLYRSRQNDCPRVMLVLVHIDITPTHTPLPVFRRIGERTKPYSGRAFWLLLRWIDGATTVVQEGCGSYHGQDHQRRKEGSFWVPSVPDDMRARYRSRQDRVMLVLVHKDITPPHTPLPVFRRIGERTKPYSGRACKQIRHLVGCVIRA